MGGETPLVKCTPWTSQVVQNPGWEEIHAPRFYMGEPGQAAFDATHIVGARNSYRGDLNVSQPCVTRFFDAVNEDNSIVL